MLRFLQKLLHYPYLGKFKYCICYKYFFKKWGRNCYVEFAIRITPQYVEMGDNVYIGYNCRIEGVSQYENDIFSPTIRLGNGVSIQQHLHLTCAQSIEIGNNTAIAANVTITDIHHPYDDINLPIEKQRLKVLPVKIGPDCKIYNNAVILPGVTLGRHVTVAANSVVNRDVPDNSVVAGVPAVIIKKYQEEEKRWEFVKLPPPLIYINILRNTSTFVFKGCKKAFRLLVQMFHKMIFKEYHYNSLIISPLHIYGANNISIGNKVCIQYKAWLAALPHTGAEKCLLKIGDGCCIGHFNHIYATKSIVFEENVLTADKVYVSDNLHGYEDITTPILKQPIIQNREVVIGAGSWLGENVCVLGSKIGKQCVIGANSVVTKDIPDFCVAVGAPARIIKRYNLVTKTWVKTDLKGNFID